MEAVRGKAPDINGKDMACSDSHLPARQGLCHLCLLCVGANELVALMEAVHMHGTVPTLPARPRC
jgi:hypothetical protein